MTSDHNEATDKVGENALRTLKARWELPAAGSDDVKRKVLVGLALRVAETVQPGFAPSRAREDISIRDEVDETMGDSLREEIYRLGDAVGGVEVTDRVFNPNDGITGISGWIGIKVYGLTDGCDISLCGDFVAAQYGRGQPMNLKATLPDRALPTVAGMLKAEFGATVEET